MKKKILFLTMMMLSAFFAFSQSSYYYYRGNKVTIQEDPGKVCVVAPKGNISGSMQMSPLNARRTATLNDAKYDIAVYQANAFTSTPTFRSAMKSTFSSSTTLVLPCYKSSTGDELTLTNYLNVKLKSAGDYSKLQTLASRYRLENIKQNTFMPLWYSMTITPQSPGTTLEIANAIYETGLFASSVADFSSNDKLCSYDPLFNQQWGLYNNTYADIDISICSAWNYATGRGIKIAILDEGIEKTHTDLAANIYGQSFDTESGTSPSKLFGDHGTHCAGIAAAVRNNGLYVAGVAPDAKLMAISNSLEGSTNSRMKRADGINWAWRNGADIISNSWRSSTQHEVIEDAIDLAFANGREGKGCIIVFAGGNFNTSILYPGNCRSKILVVGALDKDGTKASYSCYGTNLDVMAPGTDILSTLRGNKTGLNTGTSMACPHVAGLAALILERNPKLTTLQVNNIIEKNTKKIGNLSYNMQKVNGSWNEKYGYGLINAYEAVKNTPRN